MCAKNLRTDNSTSLSHAFACAWRGIIDTVKTQRNMRIHLVIAVVAVILGFVLNITTAEWCIIVICIALVFALEIINTALESVVDVSCDHYHELAKRAKDCAAGAVLVAAIASVIVGAIIFISHFIYLIFG